MGFTAINPATGELLAEYPHWSPNELEHALVEVSAMRPVWTRTPVATRCALMRRAAQLLRDRREDLAQLITSEMGKLIHDPFLAITARYQP